MNRIEAAHSQYPVIKAGSPPDVSTCPVTFVNAAPGEVGQRSMPGKRLGKRKSCVLSKDEFVSCPCNRECTADECSLPVKRIKRAGLDTVDSQGNTPLCLAVIAGQFAHAMQLIEAGADVLHVNSDGDNVLLLAAQNGHLQFLDCSELGDVNLHHVNHHGNNALMLAAANGHHDTLRWLTVMGVNCRQCNKHGDNALTLAAAAGRLQAVQWLLDGATAYIITPLDVNKENYQGNTAMMLAARNGHLNIVQLLEKCHGRITGFNQQQADAPALAVFYSRRQRGCGPIRIRSELLQKGLESELIGQHLQLCQDDWTALARRVKEQKFGSGPPANARERARQIRFLTGRGFSLEQIYAIFTDRCT